MSDISLRFDGLILLAAMAVSVAVFLLVALLAVAVALLRPPAVRARKVAGMSSLMAIAALAVAFAFFVYWDARGTAYTGPDWIDQLAYPWGVVFLLGCWTLWRLR